jgi:hypothetical protein
MTIVELFANDRKEPRLIPVPREDHIVASIHVRGIKPCSERTLGEMHTSRPNVEDKTEPFIGKPVREFNIFGTAKAFVEAAGSKNVAPTKRGIACVELTRRGCPISSQHGPVLFHQHLLFPADPGRHLEAFRGQQGSKHHHVPARFIVRARVFSQQLRLWNEIVIDKYNELPDGLPGPHIAGGSRTSIGLRKPMHTHRGAQCFQICVGTIRRAIGDNDNFKIV